MKFGRIQNVLRLAKLSKIRKKRKNENIFN